MAAVSYEEVLAAIEPKMQVEMKASFRSPEAVAFFDELIQIICRRIKDDYEQRGLLTR
jgi:ribosomal protein L5